MSKKRNRITGNRMNDVFGIDAENGLQIRKFSKRYLVLFEMKEESIRTKNAWNKFC